MHLIKLLYAAKHYLLFGTQWAVPPLHILNHVLWNYFAKGGNTAFEAWHSLSGYLIEKAAGKIKRKRGCLPINSRLHVTSGIPNLLGACDLHILLLLFQ